MNVILTFILKFMEEFMKTEELLRVWNAPDNSKLTPKQMSIRLPLHVAASISALTELYPRKTKTEIIGDLLSTAIDELVQSLSDEQYPYYDEKFSKDEPVHIFTSERDKFYDLKKKYLEEFENEIKKGNGRQKPSDENLEGNN